LTALNAALNGLTFTPTSGYVGSASINVSMTDMGTGLTSPGNVGVTINAVGPSQAAPSIAWLGNGNGSIYGETDNFAASWAGLAAAIETLYI
jgi:hypothetical protein